MNADDFAAAIKAKHPEYAEVDNTELTTRMLEKYPQYKDSVNIDKPAEPEKPKFYELEKQPGLPKTAMDAVKQLGGRVLNEVTSPFPGVDPRGIALAASELAGQAGNDIAAKAVPVLGKTLGRVTGLASSIALDPASYMAGALTSKPAKAITNKIGELASEKLPGLYKFLAKVPEQATKTLLENKGVLPEATAQAEEALTQRVQKALTGAVKERGVALNEAKAAAGMPVSVEDKVKALKDTGNEFGVHQGDLNDMAKAFGDKYGPKTHLKKMLGEWAGDYVTNPKDAATKIEDTLKANTNSGDKVGGWFPSDEVRKMFQSELMGKLEEFKSFAHFDDIKDPKQLAISIDNFNQMAEKIPEKARVKMASLLQDKINNFVDWNKSGNSIEGVLKQQYGKLADVATPEALRDSKSGFAEAKNLMDDLEKKLGGDEGKAQEFLGKIFTNPTPANQDYIKKLAKLEAVSGHPILTDLYKHFASKSFSHNISRPVFEGMEGVYAGGKLLAGDIGGAAKVLTLMGAQSPKVLKFATKLGLKAADAVPASVLKNAAKVGVNRSIAATSGLKGAQLQDSVSEESRRVLQSWKDRLRAQDAKKRP